MTVKFYSDRLSMTTTSEQDTLLGLLHDILCQHPQGLTEYDLLRMLRDRELPVFLDLDFTDPLPLFRSHFMLFHLLYRLADRLYRNELAILEIHCLKIVMRPWQQTTQRLPDQPDGLRAYYLELKNMEETKKVEIESMLDRFWLQYLRLDSRPENLAVLGLQEPASPQQIKRRYRHLALRHHPDRGGCPDRFRRISLAAETLLG